MSRRPWTDEERAELARRYPHEVTADIARDIGLSYARFPSRRSLSGNWA